MGERRYLIRLEEEYARCCDARSKLDAVVVELSKRLTHYVNENRKLREQLRNWEQSQGE